MGITTATASVADYHLIKKVKSSKFNVDHLNQYHLCFLLGKRHFEFCVIDGKSNLCLLLEDYLLDIEASNKVYILRSIFENHHLLNAGFWQTVKLAVNNPKMALVPSALFEKDCAGDYLKINSTLEPPGEELYYYKHSTEKIVSVFAAEKAVVNWFKSIYPSLNLHVVHQSSALIEGVPRQRDQTRLKSMALLLSTAAIDILVHENGHLQYCNQFRFETPLELINYIMVVMDQLGLDPNMIRVHLWGNINSQSDHFKILYKYIRNISFGARPSHLNFSFEFDEVEEHQYFDLLSLYYCE